MKKLVGLSLLNTTNVGDLVPSPLSYFKFPIPSEKVCVSAYDISEVSGKFIIYGGGGLLHLPAPDYYGGIMQFLEEICDLSQWLVSWGIGHNVHYSKEINYPQSFLKKFILHGVRDFNQTILPVVPCSSCMSPLIHHDYKIKQDIVVIGHKLDAFTGYPTMVVDSGISMQEAIEFISSASLVVTNSYHGAYWGLLLNRKVVVFNPMSTKFYGLPTDIILSSIDHWQKDMLKAKPNKGFLAKCRKMNRDYHKQVCQLVERYKNEA